MLPAKQAYERQNLIGPYDMASNLRSAARKLGKRGGKARARKLSAGRRSAIAAKGGRAKAARAR